MAFDKRIACGLLSIAMVLSLVACSPSSGEKYSFESGKQRVIKPRNEGADYHKTSTENLELISKSGLIEMYFDKNSYSIVIKETSLGNLWYSMPTESVADSAVLTLDVSDDNGVLYKLNSQDNSVAYGKARYEKKKDGIWVTYTLSEKKSKPKITIPITVKYTLKEGSFYVDISCQNIASIKKVKVENIELLKYFGASKAPQSGDFMLLPDGCGAKINTAVETKEQNYDVKIYGEDYASPNSVKHTGVVPAFGIKNGTGAFAAVIRQGDSLSTVSATKSKLGDYNTIAPNFEITPISTKTDKDRTEKYVADQSYGGNISVCYRFLSGSNATYAGIAAVSREQLIRDAVLSTRTVKETGSYPITVSLVGTGKTSNFSNKKLTTFEEARDIVELLKAKGINSLNLRYRGIFSDGLGQANLKNANFIRNLGSQSDLKALNDYMTTQEFGLFFDINMLTMDSGSRAKDIKNDKIRMTFPNSLEKYLEPASYKKNLVKPESLEKNVVSFLTEIKDFPNTGISINDAGSILYSDFSGDLISRENTKSMIADQIVSLSSNRQTMTKTGNFFMLKNIEHIVNIPMDTTYKNSQSYESIPFVQMILHGMIEYSAEPVNLAEDYTKSFLKSIEYGTTLSYVMTFADVVEKDKKDSESTLCYEQWASKVADGYKTFNDLFADLRSARITNHFIATENLTCTVYDNGTYIYVNYSPNDITYNNLVIKANSYLRVS